MKNYIDVLFRKYGEDFFGTEAMSQITDDQVEKARIWTMNELSELSKKNGLQEKGTMKALFCNYVFSEFL